MAEASCPCGQLMSTADISSFVDQYVDVKSREVYERLKFHLDEATVLRILDGLPGQIRRAIDSHEFDRILVRDVADGRVYRIFVQNGLVSVQREGQLDDREGDSLVELTCHCSSDGSGSGGHGSSGSGDSSTSKATLVFLDWDGSVVETRTVGVGEDLGELPTPKGRKGYQFKGWVQDGCLEATSRIGSVFTYRARYQKEGGPAPQVATFHSVAFVEWDTRSLSCVTVRSGEKLTKEQVPTDPVKEGHVFTGWVDSQDGQTFSLDLKISRSHVYLSSYEVKQDSGDGEGDGGTELEGMHLALLPIYGSTMRHLTKKDGDSLEDGDRPEVNALVSGYSFVDWIDRKYGIPVGQTGGRWSEFDPWYYPCLDLTNTWGISEDSQGSDLADSSFDPATIDEWKVMGDCEGTYASLDELNADINRLLAAHAKEQYLSTLRDGRIYHVQPPHWQWKGHYVLSGGFSVYHGSLEEPIWGYIPEG